MVKYKTKEERKKARKTLDEMETFGMMLHKAFNENGIDYNELAVKLSDKVHYVTPKIIKKWERDEVYPDITTIYKLADIYHLDPNKLILAKQVMQECGVASINVRLMKNISSVIDVSIWTIHYAIRIIPFVFVIFVLIRVGLSRGNF